MTGWLAKAGLVLIDPEKRRDRAGHCAHNSETLPRSLAMQAAGEAKRSKSRAWRSMMITREASLCATDQPA